MAERGGQWAGVGFGLAAYGMWGFFPLYFRQLGHVPPADLLANRAAWGCVFVSAILSARRAWPGVFAAARRPGAFIRLGIASWLVGANWLAFLWAVDQHRVMEASLGYFLTPLVNVLLGLVVLKERLRPLEWGAVVLALAAVGNELAALGSLPWISLFLGATFGLYGLVRKQVPVDAISGLWLETLCMLPPVLIYAFWQGGQGNPVFFGFDALTQILLALAGLFTALPLMFFAAATQRLNLATVGMLMYINPTLQLLTAVLLFHETVRPGRWTTFALIWVGLAIYTWSGWRGRRRSRAGSDDD